MKTFNENQETEERNNMRLQMVSRINKCLQKCEDIIESIIDHDAEVNLLTAEEFSLILTLARAICKAREQII